MIMNEKLPSIRIDQTGYASGLPVQVAALKGGTLNVFDAEGKLVKKIDGVTPVFDQASEDKVCICDIGILYEGDYMLECGGETRKISVKKDPWQSVTNALIKGLYFQRCGCELKEKYAGRFTHPACHIAPAALWEDKNVKLTVTGGWHDAGDYGKYVGPGAVTAAHMIYAYMLCRKGCEDRINIPESGNGAPDILNEARYEIEWLLKMQREDGAFYHKLTKAQFAPFIMPQDDLMQEYLMPVSHCATAAACALLALAYRAYAKIDPVFAFKLISASVRAAEWLDANPGFVPFSNPEGVRTGQYGDGNVNDELFWASCELFASTGETKYLKAAEKYYSQGLNLTEYGWSDVSGLGAVCCLFVLKEKAGEILYDRLKEEYTEKCRRIGAISKSSGYGTALAPDKYSWGSILHIMGNAMSMILYEMLTGDTSLRNAVLLQWHYALGLNALDTCFVTGFGERPVMNIHHRPSGADGITDPVPGLISGGPNKYHPYPQTRERLADTPPAKYFLDETMSADTNEIAIYWNSPAIFVGAFFAALCK